MKIYVFFIPIVLFYSYKFLKMGIQGNLISFFTWDFKVVLEHFFWNFKFCPKLIHFTLFRGPMFLDSLTVFHMVWKNQDIC